MLKKQKIQISPINIYRKLWQMEERYFFLTITTIIGKILLFFFADNKNLVINIKNTIIPNTVVSIQEYAFANQTDIKSIVIPNSVVFIDSRAFVYCKGLESVTIPNSVTTISTAAFYGCEGLKTLALGNSLNRILEDAFKRCSNLTSVTFPKSLTYIGNEAFGKCTNLKVVTCKASTPPEITPDSFYRIPKRVKFFVPKASLPAYKKAPYWKNFSFITY